MKTFGQKLKEARQDKKLTQRQLAEAIGAKHNSISNWENDQNRPDTDTIEYICGVLDITPNQLLDKSADKSIHKSLDEQLEGVNFALYSESQELSDSDKEDVINFIRFKKAEALRKEQKED